MEKLGIIGGMGPAATARLMARIVDFTWADCDQGHLDVTVLCRPQIPDRTAFLLGAPGAASFVEPMRQAARQLEALGCTAIACPCNTSHARASEVAAVLGRARLVSMVDETARLLAHAGCRKAGLLATEGTVATGVYERALARAGVAMAVPDSAGQRLVSEVIYGGVKAGRAPGAECLEPVCAALSRCGCDAVVLGCTELSCLGADPVCGGVDVLDALDVLAVACVRECGAPLRESEVARSFAPRIAQAVLGREMREAQRAELAREARGGESDASVQKVLGWDKAASQQEARRREQAMQAQEAEAQAPALRCA